MFRIAIVISVLGLFALSAPTWAHQMKRVGADPESPYTNYAGKARVEVTNNFDRTTEFSIVLRDRDTYEPINPDHWRTNIGAGKDDDTFMLEPGQKRVVVVQLRHRNMHVKICSESSASGTLNTRVCFGVKYL